MPEYCVETRHLTHRFSAEEVVLNDINLQVAQGSIYGFLGPNGAGKTTTLRLALGLLKMQKGSISFFGLAFHENRRAILKKIGSMIESPSLYGHLTATENLRLLQRVYQCPNERVNHVLNLVGLPNTGSKKVSQFSLGMKQRLSIAIALLHNPELLILDEPTNGLDPNGIIEIRELLKKLNQENGTTILVSSHLLAEIEKLVTHVGIINKGKLLFQGTLSDLKGKQELAVSTVIKTNNLEKTQQIMRALNLAPHLENEKIVLPSLTNETIAQLNQQLVANDIRVYEISHVKSDLESIFIDLINN